MFIEQFSKFIQFLVRKMATWVILSIIFSGIIFALLRIINVPQYTSTVTLIDNSNNRLAYSTIVNSSSISHEVLTSVNKKFDSERTKKGLVKDIKLSANSTSPVYTISVKSTNKEVAKYSAKQVAKVFVRKIPKIVNGADSRIVPGVQKVKIAMLTTVKVNIFISVVLSVAISAILLFLIEFFVGKVKNKTFSELLLNEIFLGEVSISKRVEDKHE